MSTAQEYNSTKMTGVLMVVSFRGCNLWLHYHLGYSSWSCYDEMMGVIATFCINRQLTVSFVQVLCKKSLSDYNNLNGQTSEKKYKIN